MSTNPGLKMAGASFDLLFGVEKDVAFRVEFVDTNSDPVDISSMTWDAKLRSSAGGPLLAAITVTPGATFIDCSLAAATTATLPRRCVWSLAETADGDRPVLSGSVTVAADGDGGVVGGSSDTATVVFTENTVEVLGVVLSGGVSGTGVDVSSGTSDPSSTPTSVGDIYIDTSGRNTWQAVGTANSSDWIQTNGGGGAAELSDLSDVNSATDTSGFVLVGDGSGFDSRALTSTDVGLGNVDNTADADKPVSDATVTALAGKSATGHGHTLSDVSDSGALAALDTVSPSEIDDEAVTLPKLAHVSTNTVLGRDTASTGDVEEMSVSTTKSMLALDNVDNTADANKPVSTATQTALDGKQATSEKGSAGGYASLDGSALVPDAQIPGGITRDSELSAAITVAIDALLDGAPGALDTLNELAASIGDDADFAGTVTAALAGKQPLDADLTSIAALTTTAYGRGLLTEVSATTNRATLVLDQIDNTADADKPVSTATQTALDGKSATGHGHTLSDVSDSGALAALDTVSATEIDDEAVTPAKLAHVATDTILGRTTAATGDVEVLTSTQARGVLGVDNTDNTSDANKPVSTATQTALDGKLDDDFTNADSGAQTDDKYLKADGAGGVAWAVATGAGGVTELSDLSDVNSSTDTNGFVLVADGSGFDARALVKGDVGLGNVDNTSDLAKPISTATQTGLDGKQDTTTELDDLSDVSAVTVGYIPVVNGTQTGFDYQAPGAGGATELSDLTDVNSSTDTNGFVLVADGSGFDSRALTSSDVGLGNVDNTSDANKPISTATQTGLDGKSATGHTHTMSNVTDAGALATLATVGTSEITNSSVTLAKMANMATASFIGRNTAATGVPEVLSTTTARTMLSIDNTDNTSDANKPVSTATQTALDLKHSTATSLVGDVTGTVSATSIGAGAVTLAKMANIATDSFIGRDTAGTGVPEVLSTGTARTILSIDNTDNTSDLAKPISTATQTGLDGKQDTTTELDDLSDVSAVTVGYIPVVNATQNGFDYQLNASGAGQLDELSDVNSATDTNGFVLVGDGSGFDARALTSADVGLGNVDNTSDANKPVSTATQTALDGKPNISSGIGAPSSTPTAVGDWYADTVGAAWFARGTASSSDWEKAGTAGLDDLYDVSITSPSTGQAIFRHSGGYWDNRLMTLADVTDSGNLAPLDTVSATEIDDEAVTLPKLAHIATDSFIGRDTAATGDVEVLSASTARTILSIDNTDNTSDLAKPISTATQTGLDGKQDTTTELDDLSDVSAVTVGHVAVVNATQTGFDFQAPGAGGATELSDLTDVGVSTPTNGNVLRADGDSWESAVLGIGEISGAGNLAALETVTSAEIDDEAVTLPKLAHIATDRILGRDTAATGDVEVLDAAAVLGIIGVTAGAEPNGTASDTVSGEVELADVTETNAGTATNRALMPDSFAASRYGSKDVSFAVFGSATACTVGNGTTPVVISSTLAGMNIVEVVASVHTAGTTGTMDLQIRRRRGATDADVLSTKATIDTTEHSTVTAAAAPVVDGANDDLVAGDLLFVDVDAVQSTAALGLSVTVVCRMP